MRQAIADLKKELPLDGVLPKHLAYLTGVYLSGLLIFTLFRIILLLQEFHQLHFLPTGQGALLVLKAFLMGLRFDTVVSGYLLTLPFLLLLGDALGGWNNRLLYRGVSWLIILCYSASFFVCSADLPFFHHFYTRVTTSILISADSESSDLLKGMVFKEWRYSWALIPFGALSLLFAWHLRKRLAAILEREEAFSRSGRLRSFAAFSALLFLGIWGRFSTQSHLDASAAYVSDYGLTNMLGLNPAYTFGLSLFHSLTGEQQEVQFMGDGEAVRNMQEYLNISEAQRFSSPIARQVSFDSTAGTRANVVLVIMESMSAGKMGRYGNPNNLTPFLDSLASESLTFDQVFNTGIHTFAGIYSTLFSQPVIKRNHPLEKTDPHTGFSNVLKQYGYTTLYFTTHDAGFDNAGAFLSASGFDEIISKSNYPPEKIVGPLGVPDDYLYEYAIGKLNQASQEGQPFFAALMTGSDHGPYVIPSYFKPRHKEATLGIVEYVDWSVRKFLTAAAQKDWYDNTIFIFVADHGNSLDKRYDMPLSYLHTPLVFHGPKIVGKARSYDCLGSQLDVFPTTMGLLQLPYVNNTAGIDLLREQRPFVCAYADDKYAVLNREFMFVARENGVSSLYHYQRGDLRNRLSEYPALAASMKRYGESFFQGAQWLRKNGMMGLQHP